MAWMRSSREGFAGAVTIVSGKVKADETAEQAVVDAVSEELAVEDVVGVLKELVSVGIVEGLRTGTSLAGWQPISRSKQSARDR